MIESMNLRRTIRRYTQKNISDELLNSLLRTASHTATMGNMQLYSVVVTREAANKAKLAPAHFGQPMVESASVLLTFCADFNRFTLYCDQREAKAGYDNFLSFMNATTDALLFTQSFCTLAEDEGLGTCYLGTTIYNPLQIIEILNLPKLTFPVATVTVGYPAELPVQPDRLPLEGIVHHESYHNYATEALNKIYAYKESLPENKQFVKENAKQTLAQVFTDVRYTKKDNIAMSSGMFDALKKQGFL
jgi:nitroreductase